ncbi:MAG: hypothetical protein Q4G43_09745 [Mobilicoccus sp.]|nr:hypothetical protein [Mobilicoccus sp.]
MGDRPCGGDRRRAVLALARGGLIDVVGTRGGLLVADPGSDDAAAEALAARIPQVIALSRETVRADAVRRHSLTAMLDAYEEIIDEMVTEPRDQRPVMPAIAG